MAKIVFCEDEARIQQLIRTILRSTSHETYIAADGIEGLEIIERERPDLIFTDISMPRCDGLQLLDALQSRPHLAHTPLVFMSSALARLSRLQEEHRRGITDYLPKPFNPSDLLAKIDEFIGVQHP